MPIIVGRQMGNGSPSPAAPMAFVTKPCCIPIIPSPMATFMSCALTAAIGAD